MNRYTIGKSLITIGESIVNTVIGFSIIGALCVGAAFLVYILRWWSFAIVVLLLSGELWRKIREKKGEEANGGE